MKRGQVRVGTCKWVKGKRIDPKYINSNGKAFKNIICLTKSSAYGSISPYCLMVKVGNTDVIMENLYQFSKLYSTVPTSKQYKSRYDKTVIWEWKSEIHAEIKKESWTIRPEYLKWRNAGMLSKEPIRYPVGRNNTHKCLFAFKNNPNGSVNPKMLDYVGGRKEIYLPIIEKTSNIYQIKRKVK